MVGASAVRPLIGVGRSAINAGITMLCAETIVLNDLCRQTLLNNVDSIINGLTEGFSPDGICHKLFPNSCGVKGLF